MDLGKPKREIEISPDREPVPREIPEPVEAPELAPIEPEKVPA